MGCGCGGSNAAPGVAVPRTETVGPQAPGYAWTGPVKRAAVEKQKEAVAAKRKPGRPPKNPAV